MAVARTAVAPRALTVPKSAAAKPGFWSKLYRAMATSRQRQAEREIALYLHNIGGKFTDDAEREIERRFLGPRY